MTSTSRTSPDRPTTKLRRATLTTDAYDAVRAMLLDETRFQPGEKISVEMIARELGTSRSPVWSAIARLDVEGLVEVSPRLGVFLVAFDAERCRALFEVREALEGMAARLAAARMKPVDLDALDAMIRRQERLLTDERFDEFGASALAFHEAIVTGAGNPLIAQTLGRILAQTNAMCRGRKVSPGERDLTLNHKDHDDILRALRRGDADGAETLARAHVRRLSSRLSA